MKTAFAPQEILLGKTPLLNSLLYSGFPIPEQFYDKGFAVLENVPNLKQAQLLVEKFIASIDTSRLPLWKIFAPKVQLAKIDEIPVCADVVESAYQVLHIDMGQPIISDEPQNMYLVTALYREQGKPVTTAKTRMMPLKGFFKDAKWGSREELEKKLVEYAEKYGDGWTKPNVYNSKRLACFARVVDAVAGTTELSKDIDKTMGQWFRDDERLKAEECLQNEYDFYKARGINLAEIEQFIQLKPGQILLFDNTRVTHGRMGKRDEKEVWQLMYGVNNATPAEIDTFRKHFVDLLKG